MKHTLAAILGLAALALPLAAPAQQKAAPGPIETRLEARKVVVAADGKETFAAAESAKPGDVIEYVATYRNTGKSPVTNLVATLPIPANTEYIPESARPAGPAATADGTTYAALPLVRKLRRNNQEIEERVPVREYRALRWSSGALAGEQAVTFAARVRVIDDRPPSEPGRQGERK